MSLVILYLAFSFFSDALRRNMPQKYVVSSKDLNLRTVSASISFLITSCLVLFVCIVRQTTQQRWHIFGIS